MEEFVEQLDAVVRVEILEQRDDVVAAQTLEQLAANGGVESLEGRYGLVLGQKTKQHRASRRVDPLEHAHRIGRRQLTHQSGQCGHVTGGEEFGRSRHDVVESFRHGTILPCGSTVDSHTSAREIGPIRRSLARIPSLGVQAWAAHRLRRREQSIEFGFDGDGLSGEYR